MLGTETEARVDGCKLSALRFASPEAASSRHGTARSFKARRLSQFDQFVPIDRELPADLNETAA